MDRLVLFLVVVPALLLTSFGAFYYIGPETASVGQESRSDRHFAQLGLPWATEEKKTPERKPPPAPAPVPKAQPAPAPALKAQPAPAPAAQAQEDKEPPAAGPGWAVNCKSKAGEKGLNCRMSQIVVAKKSGRTLSNVAFLVAPATKSSEVLLQLPLGLYLPAGATYQVDENAPQRLTFRACDRKGCYAKAPVSPETMAILRKGKQLKIDFQNLAEKPVSVALSLDGFAAAYEKIPRP